MASVAQQHLPVVVLVDVARGLHGVGVELVALAAVVLVIHLLGVAPGLALGLLAVPGIGALGLGELVDLGAGEASKQLLGKLVGDGLACRRRELSVQDGNRR